MVFLHFKTINVEYMTISTFDLVVINQTITLEQQGSRYDTSNITLDRYLAMIAFGSRHRIK